MHQKMTPICGNSERWAGVVAVLTALLITPVIGFTPTRLANGNRTDKIYSGRLEVFYNGTWGTVCDDGFNDDTSRVICRILGYSLGKFVTTPVFGAGAGEIWLDSVVCSGLKSDISECSHQVWGENDCGHGEDVGLVCLKTQEKNSGTPIRLVNGFGYDDSLSGRLEVFYNNTWGTVCDDSFTADTARVICNRLGFSSGYKVANSKFGAGRGQIWLDDVVCSGEETDISQCSHEGWGVNNCRHEEDVGLVCSNTPATPLRLVGGLGDAQSLSGRLELFYNDTWGAFCQESITLNTAKVICNLLGFSYGISFPRYMYTRRESQPVLFSSVQCTGEESDIMQCKLSNAHVCSAWRAALVQCYLPRSADISSTTKTPDSSQASTESLSTPVENSTDIPMLDHIQSSDSNVDRNGLDSRALIVGLAVGIGEPVIGIVVLVIVVVVRRHQHSHGGTHNESDAKDEHAYENGDFVVQNRRRNRACPEIASETEHQQSASRYERVVYKPPNTSDS